MQRTRKPLSSASIQAKPTFMTCTGKIPIIKPFITSKVKFSKAVDKEFVQGIVKDKYPKKMKFLNSSNTNISLYISGMFEYRGTSQKIDKHCSEPKDQGLEAIVDGRTMRMDNKRFNLASHWEDVGDRLPQDISQRDLLQRSYGNHQTMESQQAVQTPGGKGSQDKGEASHYPSHRRTTKPDRAYSDSFRLTRSKPARLTRRSVRKIHYFLQSQVLSGRRQGSKGKNKTSFKQRQKESDPMIQKLLDLVREVKKSQKYLLILLIESEALQ
ncbi:hypothetical protein O181_004003 [Austropuccinia psidii MF-1]|uniref:Uncharacterized protein n=1 Tax=Austropuccinia psidii MF-1 TaxID=1389203 RepID=A0A9Q3GE36_9BASI|nr:hypothetical protein [Austropuccinia psidii MF-1]